MVREGSDDVVAAVVVVVVVVVGVGVCAALCMLSVQITLWTTPQVLMLEWICAVNRVTERDTREAKIRKFEPLQKSGGIVLHSQARLIGK